MHVPCVDLALIISVSSRGKNGGGLISGRNMLAAKAAKEINKIVVGFCIDFWIFFHFMFYFLCTV